MYPFLPNVCSKANDTHTHIYTYVYIYNVLYICICDIQHGLTIGPSNTQIPHRPALVLQAVPAVPGLCLVGRWLNFRAEWSVTT